MVKTKVFVGNLSFKTQERDLAKEFEAAGKVASANIITRGTRSLGYGFVEMESEEEANKAVELLNKKNVDGREINVEVAKIREESADPAAAPGSPSQAAARGGRGRGSRGGVAGAGRGGRGRGGARRAPRAQGEGEKTEGAPAGSPSTGGNPATGAPRRPRAPRAPRAEEDKTPRAESATTLFVANLPFSVDDAGLAKIFDGLNLKTAHVVRKRNERSKGFGFVEFNNAEDQQKALSINNKDVDGRQLIVKVALTEAATAAANGAASSPAPEAKN